jgi:hypothetical protein
VAAAEKLQSSRLMQGRASMRGFVNSDCEVDINRLIDWNERISIGAAFTASPLILSQQ